MKIVTELGNKYSRGSFEDYTRRAKICMETNEGHTHQVDIYTTDTNKESVEMFLRSRASEKVSDLKITDWTTREADDNASKLIEDWLNEA